MRLEDRFRFAQRRSAYGVGAHLSGKDAVAMSWLARLLPDWLLGKLRQKKTGLPTRFGALT